MAEIRLQDISKRYGATRVIEELSLTVRDGELFTIVGPSGCGKSTLLHLIAGLDQPTSGRIYFDEQDATGQAPRERDVALVFQHYALYPHMTVAENLAFPLRVAKRRMALGRASIDREVRRIAALLDLEALLDRRPRELSGGQRQRAALGRALIRKPRVFLLDEPLSNLDAQLRAGMRAELRRLHDELGITMIYVTHDQIEAMTLADRLAVLDRGRLQQVGTPRDLYRSPANVFVAGFIGYPAMNLVEAHVRDGAAIAGPVRLTLPPHLHKRLREQDVTLGIRPEEVRLLPEAPGGEGDEAREVVSGIVRLVEPTGAHTWVTLEVEEGDSHLTLVGLAEQNLAAGPGQRVAISLAGTVPHVFDRNTGIRLVGGAAGAEEAGGDVTGTPAAGVTAWPSSEARPESAPLSSQAPPL